VHATGKNDMVKVVEENTPGCQVITETDSINRRREAKAKTGKDGLCGAERVQR
jgi:hypothetical protein